MSKYRHTKENGYTARKDGMNNMQFNQEVEANAGCTLRSLLGSISDQENLRNLGLEEMHGLVV